MAWVDAGAGFMGISLHLLGALLMLGALAPAAAQEPPPSAATEASLPAWLVASPPRPPSEISAAWRVVSGDAMPYPAEPSGDTAVAAMQSGYAGTPKPRFVELTATAGDYAGLWRFHARKRGKKPQAAWRLTLSDATPYRVDAQLYCDESSGDCATLRRELALLQAPRPGSEASMDEWLQIITAGPCEPGPVRMPAPRFPPQALRDEARGTVRLLLAFNACGEVRHASVYQSSGSRHLDRAAVQTARSWRVAVPDDRVGPLQGVVPVRFEIESDSLPAR